MTLHVDPPVTFDVSFWLQFQRVVLACVSEIWPITEADSGSPDLVSKQPL